MLWTDELSINVKEIDAQHRHLMDLINEFDQAARIEKGIESCHDIGEDFLRYAKVHFAFEEDLMKKFKYDQRRIHEEEHERFVLAAATLLSFSDDKDNSPENISEFLRLWLQDHIANFGIQFGNYLNERSVF